MLTWLLGWSVGLLVGRSAGWLLDGWFFRCLVGWSLVDWFVGQLVGSVIGRSVSLSVVTVTASKTRSHRFRAPTTVPLLEETSVLLFLGIIFK